MKYYTLEPDVPGSVADPRSIIQNYDTIQSIHYIFDCWPEDDILTSYPVYIVRKNLAKEFGNSNLTGFSIKACEVSKGKQFAIASPGCGKLPLYEWLHVSGRAGIDDFGITQNLRLAISESVVDTLIEFRVSNSKITELL